MYCTQVCPYCHMAAKLLEKKGIAFERVYVDGDPSRRAEMVMRASRTSVPQIFIDDKHVGGYQELAQLDLAGGLDTMLASA